MHTQLNGIVNCSRCLSGMACAIVLLLLLVQPAFSETEPNGTTGGSGPDVIGLRIGTTLAEAKAIFKSGVLISDSLRKSYKETDKTLLISLPGGGSGGPVPNGKFVNGLRAGGTNDDSSTHWLAVTFAPVPGQESIVYITRGNQLRDGKKPTFAAFEKSLLEKYGTPTQSSDRSYRDNNIRYWSYDNNGMLKKPGFMNDATRCRQSVGEIENAVNLTEQGAQLYEKLAAECGDIFLYMTWSYNGKYHGPETLINGYNVLMVGLDAARRSSNSAKAIIDKASAEVSAAAIKKGQQQKPEF